MLNIPKFSQTFVFKEIYPDFESFEKFLNEYQVVDLSVLENVDFAKYMYKCLFRRYHNSNIQYDTIEDFECDFANILEDNFDKFKKQFDYVKKIEQLSEEDYIEISRAIANQAVNPNSKPDDPTQPLDFVSSQAFTLAKDNKQQAFLRAISGIPTKLIGEMLKKCVNLFKTICTKEIFVYKEGTCE